MLDEQQTRSTAWGPKSLPGVRTGEPASGLGDAEPAA
jgi:hypothetical protein